jgi:hypothetical protein
MPHEIHRIAYAVTDGEKSNRSRWTQIGVSFLNRDGSETILLDALPTHARIVLQPPKRESPQAQQDAQPGVDEESLEL